MRFKRHIELEHGLRPIDITPLIDMVFQLLIFFMLTSSFVVQSGLKVNLPKAATGEFSQEQGLIITVSRENMLFLDKKVINNKELKSALLKARKNRMSVLIMADQRSSLGRVVEVWDMARDLGVEQVNIATDRE